MLEREGLVSPDIIRNVSNQITPTPRRRRKNQGIYETESLILYLNNNGEDIDGFFLYKIVSNSVNFFSLSPESLNRKPTNRNYLIL